MTSLTGRRIVLWMTAIAAVLINAGLLLAAYTRQHTSGCVKGVICDPALVQPYFWLGSIVFLIGMVLALFVIGFGLRAAWRRVRSTQRHGTSVSEGPPP